MGRKERDGGIMDPCWMLFPEKEAGWLEGGRKYLLPSRFFLRRKESVLLGKGSQKERRNKENKKFVFTIEKPLPDFAHRASLHAIFKWRK